MTMLQHDLNQIRARNLEHFRAFGQGSRDSQANDIRDLLAYIDELEEELSAYDGES